MGPLARRQVTVRGRNLQGALSPTIRCDFSETRIDLALGDALADVLREEAKKLGAGLQPICLPPARLALW